jgi:hypothetical protein
MTQAAKAVVWMAKMQTRYGTATLTVLVLLVVAGTLFFTNYRAGAQAQGAARSAVRWEHCELVNNDKGQCSYSTAKEAIGAENWKELAEKLHVPQKDGDKVANPRLLVFDFLGGQGWELATHSVMVINGGYGETFLFKRRVEK